ncbi:MAG: hypothetical protein KDA89_24830, partial [Planctomycetaceae bacterium]|nr:hypothetical protein [Planctomycetaceae bacterium]
MAGVGEVAGGTSAAGGVTSAERLRLLESEAANIDRQLRSWDEAEQQHQQLQVRERELRRQLNAVTAECDRQQTVLADFRAAAAVAEKDCEHAERTLSEVRTAWENAAGDLSRLWPAIPESKERFTADADSFYRWFQDRLSERRRIEERLRRLAEQLQTTESHIRPLTDTLSHAQSRLSETAAALQSAETERDELSQLRSQLLNGRPADEAEREAQTALTDAEQRVRETANARAEIDKLLAAATRDQQAADESLRSAANDLQTAETALDLWLQATAERFPTKLSAEDLSRMLSRDHQWLTTERAALMQLREAVSESAGAFQVHQRQLNSHRETRPTDESCEQVQQVLNGLQSELVLLQQQSDDLQTRVRNDELIRKKYADLEAEIQRKETVCEPWLKLNEFIGSADGAKFRRIAQERTLDILLGYTNVHLQQLADRYRLRRLPQSLNLVVIDQHMADECRSVHSLSGGESFLASLSLALGLASLTSNRLKIESLFIDEGFGSLDQETLNVAMSALSHLQAQGRKVGIISHVTEMADAIPVQIRVVKGRNGASSVVVPGQEQGAASTEAVSS